MDIIQKSINKPKSIVMIFLSLILLGILSLNNLPQELLPEMEIPKIVINTVYPSATPEDVREKITIPLESSLSSINGLKEIKSVSRNSVSTIELFLEWGTNIIEAELQVRETIDSVYTQLPQEAKKPQVIPVDPNNETLMVLGFNSTKMPLSQLKILIEDEIKIELQKVNGVGSINMIGGVVEELNFLLKAKELSNLGLSPQNLAQQFSAVHTRYPAGSFKSGDKEFLVVGDSNFTSLESIKDIQFKSINGSKIPVSELAKTVIREKEQSSIFYFNNREGVGLEIKKRLGSSQDKVSKELLIAIDRIKKQYKSSFELSLLYNKAEETKRIITSIIQSLLLGALISFILLYLVTKRLLTAILLVISLPVSLLITFFLMKTLNMSINIMSLGGIAIVLGMLVDNGVIVLENVNSNPHKPLYNSVKEVAKANLASTLTSLIVFIPLLLLPGVIGELYKELAITVSIALLTSFLVSITLIPGLYNLLSSKTNNYSPIKLFTILNIKYKQSLKKFIKNRYIMPISLFIITLLTLLFAYNINVQLVAPEDNPRILINIEMPTGSNMDKLKESCKSISQILEKTSYFEQVYLRVGAEPNDMDFFANPKSSSTTIYGTLILKKEYYRDKKGIITTLSNSDFLIQGRVNVSAPEDSISKLLGSGNYKNNWLITSNNIDELETFKSSMKQTAIKTYPDGKSKTIEAIPKRNLLNRSQLDPESIFKFVRSHLSGVPAGTIIIDEIPYKIKFINEMSPYITIDDLNELRMPIDKGKSIIVRDYVDFNESMQTKLLYRENKQDAIILSSNETINIEELKQNNNLNFKSITSSILKKNFKEIIMIFLLAIVFIYLFLGAQFESFLIPFLLLITLPLSLLGVGILLLITNSTLNLNSSLGILVLFGIVVNNSIVLKEKTNQLVKSGKSNNYAVFISAIERFLPILITSLTTVLSLLPIALEIFGKNSQSGMAWVIIGGMITSTFLTLYIVPSLSIRSKKNEK